MDNRPRCRSAGSESRLLNSYRGRALEPPGFSERSRGCASYKLVYIAWLGGFPPDRNDPETRRPPEWLLARGFYKLLPSLTADERFVVESFLADKSSFVGNHAAEGRMDHPASPRHIDRMAGWRNGTTARLLASIAAKIVLAPPFKFTECS